MSDTCTLALHFRRWVPLLVLGLWLAAPAQASDGLCWTRCERAFTQCLWDAGCRYYACNGGASCGRDGYCPGTNQPCGLRGCNPGPCLQGRGDCREGCRDWLVELRAVADLKIDPVVRDQLVASLDEIELEIDLAADHLGATVQKRLGAFRDSLETLYQHKKLDLATSWSFQEIARAVEDGIDRHGVRSRLRDEIGLGSGPVPSDACSANTAKTH